MVKQIEQIVLSALTDLNEELENDSLVKINGKTKLFGGTGPLDSLALVSLVTDLEEKISDEFDVDIVIADERAMSQRTSPFRNVEALIAYIEKLLNE